MSSCKEQFLQANKKRFFAPYNCFTSCMLKNEEQIFINLGTQASHMKISLMYKHCGKDGNAKKHVAAAKELLKELGERVQEEKPIEDISMNTLGGVDSKKVQDASGAFLTVISSLIAAKDMSEDENTLLQRQLEFAKKFLSEEALEELEQMAIPEEDKSDCAPNAIGYFPRSFLKENPEIRDPDYIKKFRK